MKNYKTMLLGIAVILLGIACGVNKIDWLQYILPFVGIIITVIGYIFSDIK